MFFAARCTGCAAAQERTAAQRRQVAAADPGTAYHLYTANTASPAPSCFFQMPSRHCGSALYYTTAAIPFRPPRPLCGAAEAVHSQPRPPLAAKAWGGAVARRQIFLYGISTSLYVYFYLSSFLSSVYVKSVKIYYSSSSNGECYLPGCLLISTTTIPYL
jgi:hypothetical protein